MKATKPKRSNGYFRAIKTLCVSLHGRPQTIKQLSEATGIRRITVGEYIRILHVKPNCVYIADWHRTYRAGPWSALWSWGYCLDDIPRPLPLSKAERNRRDRVKHARNKTQTGVKYVSQ